MYSSSPPPPSRDCSPWPARLGWRACAHAWPALPTPLAFLSLRGGYGPASWACAAGGPSSPGTWGPRAALVTFVRCRRASRDVCKLQTDPRGSAAVPAMLGAGGFPPPALPPPPSRGGFLPLPPSSLSLGTPSKGALGVPGARVGLLRGLLQCSHAAALGAGWGGRIGEPGGVFAGSRAAAGSGGVLE